MIDLFALARALAQHPGLTAKRELRTVADVLGGDGDDAAILPAASVGRTVAAAEAIAPGMLAEAPEVAGIAGAIAVLNDIAASGARPVAILDTVVAPDRASLEAILRGVARGAELAGVPVVGGHATIATGVERALSTFAIGHAVEPLSAARARAGDPLCLVACLDGEAHEAGGVGFFTHLRGPRRERLAGDLVLLAEAGEAGEAWAARDVSMPGIAGSLVQMLDATGGLGATLDLDALPVPEQVSIERWLTLFPSYAFLVAGDPAALERRFGSAGLVFAEVGRLDASGVVRLSAGGESTRLWDLAQEPLTGLSAR